MAEITDLLNSGVLDHASRHALGGDDPLTPADIGAAAAAPENSNYRIKDGSELQLRETSPTPGWRTVWLVGGQLNFGDLDVSS